MSIDPSGKPIEILLVEDNSNDICLLQEILSEANSCCFKLSYVSRLSEAISRLEKERCDVVLLDLSLPDSCGLETFTMLHRRAEAVPIIILSGFEDEVAALEAVRQGAQDYLVKGQVAGHELFRVMRYAIERKRVQEELRRAHDELEKRVQERTAQLAKANRALQDEIVLHKKAQEQIQASLKEKELLLKEIQHRIKNNLQVISSLLSLQSNSIQNQEVAKMLQQSQERVRSMALIYEQLHRTADITQVNFAQYLRKLSAYLFHSYGVSTEALRLRLELDEAVLGVDFAIPCGLIVNELLSNALKYAFPKGRSGEICIEFRSVPRGEFLLVIRDDGVGFPSGGIARPESIGLGLVQTLTEQLGGTCTIESGGGTEVQINFAIPDLVQAPLVGRN